MCLRRNSASRADFGFIVSLHQVLNEINKMKRLSYFHQFLAETDGIL